MRSPVCLSCALLYAYRALSCMPIVRSPVCLSCALLYAYRALSCMPIVRSPVCLSCALLYAYRALSFSTPLNTSQHLAPPPFPLPPKQHPAQLHPTRPHPCSVRCSLSMLLLASNRLQSMRSPHCSPQHLSPPVCLPSRPPKAVACATAPYQAASLQRSSLRNCSLTGRIPAVFGALSALQVLLLDSNHLLRNCSLTGRIPAVFGALSALQVLLLDSNRLQGPLLGEESRGLLSLQRFHSHLGLRQSSSHASSLLSPLPFPQSSSLRNCSLTGRIPAVFGALSALQVLLLDSNRLQGPLLGEESRGLLSLQHVDLSDNELEGGVVFFPQLTSLKHLLLGWNRFSLLPAKLGFLPNLRTLVLDHNRIGNTLSERLSSLSNLQTLVLDNNPIGGSLPAGFSALTNLVTISMSRCQLGNALFNTSLLINLQKIDVSDNEILYNVQDALGASLRNLRHVDLSNNLFLGSFPESMSDLQALAILNADNNNIDLQLPDLSGSAGSGALHYVSLINNQLDDTGGKIRRKIPQYLIDLVSNSSLRLWENPFCNFTLVIPTLAPACDRYNEKIQPPVFLPSPGASLDDIVFTSDPFCPSHTCDPTAAAAYPSFYAYRVAAACVCAKALKVLLRLVHSPNLYFSKSLAKDLQRGLEAQFGWETGQAWIRQVRTKRDASQLLEVLIFLPGGQKWTAAIVNAVVMRFVRHNVSMGVSFGPYRFEGFVSPIPPPPLTVPPPPPPTPSKTSSILFPILFTSLLLVILLLLFICWRSNIWGRTKGSPPSTVTLTTLKIPGLMKGDEWEITISPSDSKRINGRQTYLVHGVCFFRYDDLIAATDHFSHVIGHGSFADVYLGHLDESLLPESAAASKDNGQANGQVEKKGDGALSSGASADAAAAEIECSPAAAGAAAAGIDNEGSSTTPSTAKGASIDSSQPQGTPVAVKRVREAALRSDFSVSTFINEIKVLSSISHPNLVPLIGFCREAQELMLVYTYAPNGSLFDNLHGGLKEQGGLRDWGRRIDVLVGAASGLEYLHGELEVPIVHGDVKPENILIAASGEGLLSDFGLSEFVREASVHTPASTIVRVKGSVGYVCPEYSSTGVLNSKCDVYSLGIVVLETLTGLPPQIEDQHLGTSTHIRDLVSALLRKHDSDPSAVLDPALPSNLPKVPAWRLLQLALRCTAPTGRDRPHMGEVLSELLFVQNALRKS
ncbi:unnamed protein product [Closterium sp. Yama58-4]|nr:unnamed protein product [Closterium sp. Yama58-4]